MNRNLIFFNTEITPIRKLLLMHVAAGGKLIDYTETGNPVSFTTNVSKPLSVLAAFSPVQAGSGDTSPENVRPITGWSGVTAWRTGVNLFDEAYTGIDENMHREYVFVGNNTVYISTSCPVTGTGSALLFAQTGRATDGESTSGNGISNNQARQLTPVDGWVTISYRIQSGIDPRDYETMLNFGTTRLPYSPYTGQSYTVTFPALGKNLLPNKKCISGDNIFFGTDEVKAPYINIHSITLPPGTYTVSVETQDTGLTNLYVAEVGNSATIALQYNTKNLTFTISETTDLRIWAYKNGYGQIGDGAITTFQLEEGSSATAYEPFTNTAYGGTLDLSAGVLTVECAEIDLGSLNYYTSEQGGSTAFVCDTGVLFDGRDFICNQYKTIIATYWTDMTDNSIMAHPNGRIFRIRDDRYTDKDVFKAAMAEQGAKLVYPLATPLVYQLTPTEILSLVGDNTIWSDLNGDLTVTYKKKG